MQVTCTQTAIDSKVYQQQFDQQMQLQRESWKLNHEAQMQQLQFVHSETMAKEIAGPLQVVLAVLVIASGAIYLIRKNILASIEIAKIDATGPADVVNNYYGKDEPEEQ